MSWNNSTEFENLSNSCEPINFSKFEYLDECANGFDDIQLLNSDNNIDKQDNDIILDDIQLLNSDNNIDKQDNDIILDDNLFAEYWQNKKSYAMQIEQSLEDVRVAGLLFAKFGNVGGFLENEFMQRLDVVCHKLNEYSNQFRRKS